MNNNNSNNNSSCDLEGGNEVTKQLFEPIIILFTEHWNGWHVAMVRLVTDELSEQGYQVIGATCLERKSERWETKGGR